MYSPGICSEAQGKTGMLHPTGDICFQLYTEAGLSSNFNETIAHAIHSLTLNELWAFNPAATEENGIPVVNPRLNDPTTNVRVVPNAPLDMIGRFD